MNNFRRNNERGFSLVEIIIVISIIAIMSAILGPKAIEAQNKSKSNGLKDEFSTMISAFTTLGTSGGSAIHAIKTDIKDASDNKIMTDYVVPIAPSAAFGTTTTSEVFRRTQDAKKPVTLTYGLNTITVGTETAYVGTVRHTGALIETAKAFGTAVNASSMSSQGATGIAPIFSLNETKMLDDFIISPNGLDWAEFEQGFTGTSVDILAAMFGGPITNTAVSYLPYEPGADTVLDAKNVKAPIELTLVDIDAIEASSSGSSISTLTDGSRGSVYQVTGLMSRTDFTAFVGANAPIFGTADASKMYDKIEEGFIIGNPVFIPHREKDIIKSTDSDLKNGFYRP